MKYTASRLSDGNKIFPAEIHLEENGVTVKIPGFLSGKTKFMNYEHITAVEINTPMIGFSSITLYYQGNKAFAHGFTKEEVKQIKATIDRKRKESKTTIIHSNAHVAEHPKKLSPPAPVISSISNIPPVSKESENLYSSQLEKLIEIAITDGELTEKEKQVLFKRAEAEGIDLDEFEMVLEARIPNKKPTKNNVQLLKENKELNRNQLDKLIELALADGIVTEQEKQVLIKKATELGIEQDELEVILEAKLHLRQKEGIGSAQKDNVIKCPSCNDIIPALSKVCPSCDFVIGATRSSSGSEKSLEDLIADIEDTLVEIKTIKQPNVFATLYEHVHITVPILTFILFIIGYRITSDFLILLSILLIFVSIAIIRSRQNKNKSQSEKKSFSSLKAIFEKYARTARTLFGENKKVKLLLEELNIELTYAEKKRNKNRKIEYVSYSIIVIIAISIFFLPNKGDKRIEEEKTIRETVLEYINTGDAKKAEEYYILHANDEGLVGYHIRDLAITVMQALVDQNLLEEAESYLSKGHHVNTSMGDVAKPLVLAYVKKGDIKSAKRIISSVNEYHQEGLKKLLPKN
ncbi:hypothetical protein [Pseudopedobacter beijingensis]|uniref:TerB family tellurite resistance protein n=1 Tax=Pseudopedobacter beijingensis TaxID=1207056 RepID=A0ABW4I8D1_9SPHI